MCITLVNYCYTSLVMRDTRSSYSLDVRGLRFASKLSLVLALVFSAVHYGTTWASERLLLTRASAPTQTAALPFAVEPLTNPVVDPLKSYEQTLSTKSTGVAASDSLVRARVRMLHISGETLSLMEYGTSVMEIPFTKQGRIPTGLAMAHVISTEGDIFSQVYFPGCSVSAPLPSNTQTPCITVSPEAIEHIVGFVGDGTPVFVIAEKGVAGTTPNTPLPRVSARAFIVADVETGDVYAEKDAATPRPIASISKLFTALVARETIRDDRTMTVTRDDQSQTEGVPGSIRAGESFTVDELLYPLLMESNNSAAYTLARYEDAAQFIKRINQKVAALGMNATTLDDPSGLSANNVSNPTDLVTLLRHIRDYHSLLFDITGARTKTLQAENGRTYSFTNFNHFAGDDGFVGGKTGFIAEAGQTYAGVFEVPTEAGTSTIAIVVLGSEDRKKDTAALLSWFRDR